MNAPIRRLSTVVAVLFAALLISTTFIQFVEAKSINARSDNRRTLLSTYSRDRGQILVGDTPVAKSVPSNDQYAYLRTYPKGPEYAHITGYYSFFGAAGGLESAEQSLLSGSSDQLFYRRVSDLFTGRKPKGATLETTIDPAVQDAAEKALGNQRGAAVALDPKTGAILALVSHPTYDPNALASHDLTAVVNTSKKLESNPNRPLVDRAIAGDLYPPGSTFKVITAAAALSSGKFTPSTLIPGPAKLDLPQTSVPLVNDFPSACGPNDKTSLDHALTISCNTAYGWLGMNLGAEAMNAQAARFGFGDPLSIPMTVTPSVFPADPNPPQLAQSSIGQFDTRVTPLQMAMVAAGIANRGTVMKPYLVQSILGSDLQVIDSAQPTQLSQAVTPEVAAELTDMMINVVRQGTGTAAQISGVTVAGKTGTAQHGTGLPPHAWFIAFAPADSDPKIAVAVVVEDGGNAGNEAVGGRVAAPIAKAMIEARLKKS